MERSGFTNSLYFLLSLVAEVSTGMSAVVRIQRSVRSQQSKRQELPKPRLGQPEVQAMNGPCRAT